MMLFVIIMFIYIIIKIYYELKFELLIRYQKNNLLDSLM